MDTKQRVMAIGAVIGAVLGAGVSYLLMTAPADLEEGEEPKPITARELIGLTSGAALVIRRLDDFRRRL